jgi:hypothetical protein
MKGDAKTAKGKLLAKTESKTLLKLNGNRSQAVICNNGTKDVWLAYGPTAAAEEGIYLKKEGGSYVLEGYSGEVTAITKEGESLVTFVEI